MIFRLVFVAALAGCALGQARNGTNRKRVLITGSSDGIGRQTAFQLLRDFPSLPLVLHGRNSSRCANVTAWLEAKVPGASQRLNCVTGDFLRLQEVEDLAEKIVRDYPDLDTVMLNAGVFRRNGAGSRQTAQGLDETFQVNHLAHMLLLDRLSPLLARNTPSRFVFTASAAHWWAKDPKTWDDYQSANAVNSSLSFEGYKAFELVRYGRSKTYNIMTGMEAAKRLPAGVTVLSAHPGHWQTKLSGWGGSPVERVTIIAYLASEPSLDNATNGAYFDQYVGSSWRASLGATSGVVRNGAFRAQLWRDSDALLRDLSFPLREL